MKISLPTDHRPMTSVPRAAWQSARKKDLERAETLIRPHRERRAQGLRHPVYDFLFEYYNFRPSHLLRWTPGIDIFLEEADANDLPHPQAKIDSHGAYLDRSHLPKHRFESWRWILTLLRHTVERPAHFQCYGLHEWAMVYRGEKRHSTVPIRLAPSELEIFLATQSLSCTHYDAFRFFTPAARPLNAHPLQHNTRHTYEQRGCIHVTMDLYKWSYKLSPWIATSLILDALDLAIESRQLDMQASPYDLTAWGFPPIKIETAEGRNEYQRHQARLAQKAIPIRHRLIQAYEQILCFNS